MKRYRVVICTSLTILFLCNAAFSAEPRTLLEEGEYYRTLNELISKAETSIDIVIGTIVVTPADPENPVNKLMDSLIEARERGVRVRIILEDRGSSGNFFAYRNLLENGMDIYFDTSRLLINSKSVVIDSGVCVIGGLSWSPDSWKEGNAISVILDSKDMAEAVGNSISKLLLTESAPFVEEKPEGVLIPDDFLLLEKYGIKFIEERGNQSLDLYLSLIKEAQEKGTNELVFDYDKWGDLICLKEAFFREFESAEERSEHYKRRLMQILKILRDRFEFIEFDEKSGKVTLIEQFGLDLSGPGEAAHCFIIPYKFWDARYAYRLDLNTKYMYLVSLLEAKKSARSPYWFSNEYMLSDMYSLSLKSVTAGLHNLEHINLLEIASSPEEIEGKPKNVYRNNKIITEDEFNEKIAEFEEAHSAKIVKQAREEATKLNEPNDLFIIKTFINLIWKYDYSLVRRANVNTLHYKRGSNLRHISTTIKLLEKE